MSKQEPSGFLKGVNDFREEFRDGTLYTMIAPCALPTTIRDVAETIINYKNFSTAQKAGAITGFILGSSLGWGLGVIGGSSLATSYEVEKGPIVIALGVTNILSLGYEGVRWAVNKFSKKKSLETSLD